MATVSRMAVEVEEAACAAGSAEGERSAQRQLPGCSLEQRLSLDEERSTGGQAASSCAVRSVALTPMFLIILKGSSGTLCHLSHGSRKCNISFHLGGGGVISERKNI